MLCRQNDELRKASGPSAEVLADWELKTMDECQVTRLQVR